MMLGAIIGNVVDMLIQGFFGLELEDALNATANTMSLPVQVLFFVIIAPFGEELVFRKLILDRIAPYGEGAAILFSGLTFALFHGNFNQLFYAFGIGLILAYIYVKTGSYLRCVLLHAVVNAMFGVIFPYWFDLCGKNTILQMLISLGEWALCFIGVIFFIVLLACRKVNIEKSKYSLSKSSFSCAFSNPTFIIYAVVLGLTIFSNYFSEIM
jgi:membrane protease YdiL (CAAX protease family)